MSAKAFIMGVLTGIGAIVMSRNQKKKQITLPGKPSQLSRPATGTRPQPIQIIAPDQQFAPNSKATHAPKADILLSAGPRKGQKDTELGEDVAGIALSPDRIVFWVLDGTSDSSSILTDKGVEILSSRLLALTLGAILHQLAPLHQTAENLLEAAFEVVEDYMQEQVVQQRTHLEKFIITQHAGLSHWQVSTTILLGILNADSKAELLRIGDSKALCFNEAFELLENTIGDKPSPDTLGRLYARLTYDSANADVPFSFALMPPQREEQRHIVKLDNVRRVIAFSDGIGHSTEQYLRLMLGRQNYSHFQVNLARIPNRTFDDKTLVLASFEPLPSL